MVLRKIYQLTGQSIDFVRGDVRETDMIKKLFCYTELMRFFILRV